MTTDETNQSETEEQSVESEEKPVEAVSTPAVSSIPPVADPMVVLTTERDRMRDQLVRALADFDNYRKRSKRDEADALRRGKEDVLRELLPVFDNLERAAVAASTATDIKAIADGVAMVLRLFSDSLGRVGGKRVESVGQPFDPNLHEAIVQVDSEIYGPGIVASEVVPGYLIGERLLRPAMVAVSRGPGAAPEARSVEAPESEPTPDDEPTASDPS